MLFLCPVFVAKADSPPFFFCRATNVNMHTMMKIAWLRFISYEIKPVNKDSKAVFSL